MFMAASPPPKRMTWDGPDPAFEEIVRRVYQSRSQRDDWGRGPPSSKSKLWDSFVFPILLGLNKRSAQAVYGKRVLEDLLDFEQALATKEDDTWTSRVREQLEVERQRIEGSPGEGYKRAMVDYIDGRLEGADLVRSVFTAARFVDEDVDPKHLRAIREDFDAEFEYALTSVDQGEIHGIGYVKFVIWLHSIDSGVRLTPPNGLIQRTLKYKDIDVPAPIGTGDEKRIQFGETCTATKQVRDALQDEIAEDLWEREVQNAAWLLGTTRSLLTGDQSAKRKLDASALLDFVQETDRSIGGLNSELADVEALQAFGSDLRTFLKAR